MEERPTLHPADYVVAIAVLVVPLVMGFVIASREAKKMTRTDYLLGGRQMTLFPVAMSLFITFQSAIALLGVPSEIYQYGNGIVYNCLGYTLCYIVCYFTFVPLMYSLEVTSIYEYLDLRFRSQTVRMLSVLLGCLQTIFYMAIALLSPALALQAVADIPLWLSVLVAGLVGTVYTCVGGIKSVIWTDVFQTVILYVGLLALIVKGSLAVGGFSNAWAIASNDGRIHVPKFSPDPRVRMSFWGSITGAFFTWLSCCYNQSTLQRIRSMKTLKEAKLSLIVNIPFLISFYLLLMFVGIVTYSYFDHIRCDAYEGKLVINANQVSPYFVLHAMNDVPGFAGLYMAMLFCGSLSTLSSGVNALAANTVEDLLQHPLRSFSERAVTTVSKIAAAFFGVLICCMAYAAQYLRGPVTQMVGSIYGSFGSPILGMFLIGCLSPWGNSYGALAGGVSSLAFTLWLNIGGLFYGRKTQPLDPAPIDQCGVYNASGVDQFMRIIDAPYQDVTSNISSFMLESETEKESDAYAYGFFLNDISYEWYSVLGSVICVVVGMIVSYATRHKVENYDSDLVFPICKRLWSPHISNESNEVKDLPMEKSLDNRKC